MVCICTSLSLCSTSHELAQQQQLSAHADISQQKRADIPCFAYSVILVFPCPMQVTIFQVSIDPKIEYLIIVAERYVLHFSFQTFYICMKSESRVSLIRREGVLCDMFCWGTKHYCSFLSFVRIYGVSQMNNLKNCNYSIIYVKRIDLSKQIGMYRATLCEGITSFYWETSRRDLELLVLVRIAGLEKRKWLGAPYLCFLYFSH